MKQMSLMESLFKKKKEKSCEEEDVTPRKAA